MFMPLPFASKELPNGKKLYRRVHGFTMALVANGNAVVEFNVPYNACKVNKAEIIGAPEGVKCDLEVLDTPAGLVQQSWGVPANEAVAGLMLNQFAFDLNIAKDFYEERSEYDADLIKDMKIKVTLKNSTDSTKLIGVNIVLHEVK